MLKYLTFFISTETFYISMPKILSLTSTDWKQMVEIRMMTLRYELTLQRKKNKRIMEHTFLRTHDEALPFTQLNVN